MGHSFSCHNTPPNMRTQLGTQLNSDCLRNSLSLDLFPSFLIFVAAVLEVGLCEAVADPESLLGRARTCTRHPFSTACLHRYQTVIQPCMWFMEEPSQFSVGQTQHSLTCSIMEKPHTGLEDCLKMLLSCFRKRMSDLHRRRSKSRPPSSS